MAEGEHNHASGTTNLLYHELSSFFYPLKLLMEHEGRLLSIFSNSLDSGLIETKQIVNNYDYF